MEQTYIVNMERVQTSIDEQAFEIHRIADWLVCVVEEMRYANAMTRIKLGTMDDKQLKDQGY